jgi:hypothetical protein
VITRELDGCIVHCRHCGHMWSYPNSSLSDEIALSNYGTLILRQTASPLSAGPDHRADEDGQL